MSVAAARDGIEFPPGFNAVPLLRDLWHNAFALRSPDGAAHRRAKTFHSPLRFALTYLDHRLRQQDTGVLSFSVMHLDMYRAAYRWPAGHERDVWIAPRGIGKSETLLVALPLWALAHGHRQFFLALSWTKEQATGWLANLRMELDENELLRYDFPELAAKRSRGARNTASVVVSEQAVAAAGGLGGTHLGLNVGSRRPDLIIIDDPEPADEDYTATAKLKLQSKIVTSILRMGSRDAVTAIAGTTTMYGSMVHDAVDAALGRPPRPGGDWVARQGFTPHYYPAILPDGTSVHPQRWSVAELERQRRADPAEYEKNMLNDPPSTATGAQAFWTGASFRYDERFETVTRCLHVDVATTTRGDLCVAAMVGRNARGMACVERVEWGRWDVHGIRNVIHDFYATPRIKPTIYIEGNQGGDTWLDSLAPWPLGAEYEITHATVAKEKRIRAAFNYYRARQVLHLYPHPELERELCAWPSSKHDDIPDAVAGGILRMLT